MGVEASSIIQPRSYNPAFPRVFPHKEKDGDGVTKAEELGNLNDVHM